MLRKLSLKSIIILTLSTIIVTILVVFLTQKQSNPFQIHLKTPEGILIENKIEEDEIQILHFWAAWCQPCITELPGLIDFAKRNENRKIKIYVISLDTSWDAAFKVLPKTGLSKNLIPLIDPTGKSAEAVGTFQYPETYILRDHGRNVKKLVGIQNWIEIEKALF